VLLVEDNPVNRALAVRVLGKLGYSADLAVDGQEAVDATARRRYTAVLMDCRLPRMDGFRATTEIRLREGVARHTPIIAVTAGLPEDRERCLAAGMDACVAKPLRIGDLERSLARWAPVPDAAFPRPAAPAAALAREPVDVDPLAAPVDASSLATPGNADSLATPVDVERLATLRELDQPGTHGVGRPSLLGDLADAFLASAPLDVAAFRAAAAAGDPTAMRAAAHRLRGAATTVGLVVLAALCVDVETLSGAGALEPARELVPRLEAELDRARKALDAAVSSLR
jgi:two-component system sensor histidine kinase/response regulator